MHQYHRSPVLTCWLFNRRKAKFKSIRPIQPVASLKVRPDDVPTREGFEHFYNSDFDSAIQDFEKAQKAHPDDPFAVNHYLLEAVLVREIDREGALNSFGRKNPMSIRGSESVYRNSRKWLWTSQRSV